MPEAITGVHHVTAICSSPQENIDFYTRKLSLRLVKQTVNFDSVDTYHFYYGDRTGAPGTILTFFPFVDAGPGRCGAGMASAVAYATSVGGIEAFVERLSEHDVEFDGPFERFGETVITFGDPDRLPLEIVERGETGSEVGPIAGVTLRVEDPEPTARLLTDLLGMKAEGESADSAGRRWRFRMGDGGSVDLLRSDEAGIARQGAGAIHHVAFRAPDDASHLEWRERVAAYGLNVTPVIDRQYFNAIYFREPGGVLFEIATDPPGFAIDEPVESLGASLKLPPKYEPQRERIERALPPVRLPA
ncbi:MAG: ring-cleaving dioxygenase [Pseudomonadota bacterium]